MQTFVQLLEENLTKADFDRLPEMLGISKNLLTKSLGDPANFRMPQIVQLSAIINKPGITPGVLIFEYGLGMDRLSGTDLNAIAREQGASLAMVKQAA